MFGLKKKLFGELERYVDTVAFAIAEEALREQKQLGQTEDRRTIAAMVNVLIGRESSPSHTEHERQAGMNLASTMLQAKRDIRHAAVMCLRTTLFTHPETVCVISGTIRWIETLGDIPGVGTNPDVMRRMAYEMAMKYCPYAIQR